MQTVTVNLDNLFNYLVLLVNNEPIGCFMNLKERNESYMKTFEQIKKVDDPTNIVLTFSDIEYKNICEVIQPYSKEAFDKITLACYTKREMFDKYPEIFSED